MEVSEAVMTYEAGKAVEVYNISVERLKVGGEITIHWCHSFRLENGIGCSYLKSEMEPIGPQKLPWHYTAQFAAQSACSSAADTKLISSANILET